MNATQEATKHRSLAHKPSAHKPPLRPQRVLSLILGGGRGTRLYPLTKLRSKPAVPIAGKYRLIDIPVSNCINSGLRQIYVLTQFLSASLHQHIAGTYKFDPFGRGFVEVLAAQQTNEAADWYQGTADAVRQNLRYIENLRPQAVLILSGDQLYHMDFGQMLRTHEGSGAAVTIAVLPVDRQQAVGCGIVRLDDAGRVVGFVEKPKTAGQFETLETPPDWFERRSLGAERPFLASMGIYLFNREALLSLFNTLPHATDFGTEIFPSSISTLHVQAHVFNGYWEDLGTIKSYHEANLALATEDPPFDFHTTESVIYTHMRNLPGSRVCNAVLEHCLISDGCVIACGAHLERSVIGQRSRIGQGVTLRETVMLGADRFETDAERAENRDHDLPDIGVGDGTVIERAILDENCRIGRHARIVNCRGVAEADGENFVIRDGIVVIPSGAVVPDYAEI
jgi:glucose-1-phosphate adenylyltransferase